MEGEEKPGHDIDEEVKCIVSRDCSSNIVTLRAQEKRLVL